MHALHTLLQEKMKKTTHYKGHRWTTDELKTLMKLWAEDTSLEDIAEALGATTHATVKQVIRMRQEGIPLKRRDKGRNSEEDRSGRRGQPWSQGEVEYLIRRRNEKATNEELAADLGRSWAAICAMIGRLRAEGVPVAMRGMGVRRLWDAENLKAVSTNFEELSIIQLNQSPRRSFKGRLRHAR